MAISPSMAQQPPASLGDLLLKGMVAVLQIDTWPCLYTGVFEQQRSLPGSALAVKSSGQFLHDCNYGLLWETAVPVASTQIYSNVGQRYAVNSSGTVKPLTGRVQARIANLLLSLMGGDASSLEHDFTHTVQGEDSAAIVLLPRRAALTQHIKQITIASLQKGIAISIETQSGAMTDIRLLKMRTQLLPAVTVCARQSPQASITCPLLFDASAATK